MVICLERGADLHNGPADATATHCLSKIQIGFTSLLPAHPGSPGQRAVKRVCVCVRSRQHQTCSSGFAAVGPCWDRWTDTVLLHKPSWTYCASIIIRMVVTIDLDVAAGR